VRSMSVRVDTQAKDFVRSFSEDTSTLAVVTTFSRERRPLPALVSAMRPPSGENGLLAVARAAHSLTHADVLWRTATAFVAFCCMASAIY